MSAESWKLEKDLCRCCHAEGSFHNLSQTRSHLGKEEVYSEMLRSALNIDLSPVSGPLCAKTYTICDGCALRLRDATHFRQQVMTCEEYFKDMYHNVLKTLSPSTNVSIEVKQETLPSCDAVIKVEYPQLDDDDDDNDGFDMQFDDDDDDDDKTVLQMKLEDAKRKAKAKAKPKTKAKKAPKRPRPKKPNADEAGTTGDNEAENPKPKKGKDFSIIKADGVKKGLCNECGAVVALDRIERHILATHSIQKCSLCSLTFKTNRERIKHLGDQHQVYEIRSAKSTTLQKFGNFPCDVCNKKFPLAVRLVRHKYNEHQLMECPDCPKRFTKRVLAKHWQAEHSETMPTCGVCGYKHVDKSRILDHQRKVHLKEKNVACPHCEMKFFNEAYLKRHMIKHGAEKKFQCSFCFKKFPRKTTLRMHEKIHTGEKNKECPICKERFVQKASLNYHMTKYHPDARVGECS